MRRISLMGWVVACVGDPEPGARMMTVRYELWDEDRQCWALRELERPERYWSTFYANNCTAELEGGYTNFERFTPLADFEAHCTRFIDIDGACTLHDPFIVPCEAVPGCCDAVRAEYARRCSSPYTWEP